MSTPNVPAAPAATRQTFSRKLARSDTPPRVFTAAPAAKLKFVAADPAKASAATGGAADGKAPKSIGTLEGYALVWNELSDDRGGYKVRLAPNSATFNVPTFALWHHDYAMPLGNSDNSTLRIHPDEYGVRVEIDLPDTQAGRDAAELVGRKDVQGMSFGMINVQEWTENRENDVTIVTFTKYGVDEVTVTAIPAFTSTSIEVQKPEEDKGSAAGTADGTSNSYAADVARLDRLRLDAYGRI